MRIIFYIAQLSGGGAERVISNLANTFCEDGHEVQMVTTVKKDNEYSLNRNVVRHVIDDELTAQGKKLSIISRIQYLRWLCDSFQADILVSFMGANYHAVIATLGKKTKSVISVRNMPEHEYPGLFNRIFSHLLFRFTNGCVFQTDEAKAWFPKQVQKKSTIIFNAVGDDFFHTELKTQPSVIVTCGRLEPQKNHAMLIEAMKKVKEKVDNVRLRIYGEGSLQAELEQQIDQMGLSASVFLMGKTDNVPDVLSNAEVFVLSSDFEGMPNALMEAIAMGLPCISTDCSCGGPKMLLREDNGILVPVGNTDAMANAIIEMLTGNNKLEYAKRAKLFSNNFKPDTIYNEWKCYLESIK